MTSNVLGRQRAAGHDREVGANGKRPANQARARSRELSLAELITATANGRTERVRLKAGEVLVAEGDAADDVYVVSTGRLEVSVASPSGGGDGQPVSTIEAGSVIGEIAALSGATRSATVRAAVRSEVLRIPAECCRELLRDSPAVGEELARQGTERLRHTQFLTHLTALFAGIPSDAIAAVERLSEWVSLRGGERLFAEGDPGDAAYVVVTGRVRALRRSPDGDVELAESGRGELVGEMALLDDGPRMASVYAVRDTHLVRFSRAAYEELVGRYPHAGLLMAQTMLRRVRETAERRDRVSIAVVPASPQVDVDAFVASLTASLGDRARVVASGDVDRALGFDGIAQSGDEDVGALRLNYWLEDLEERTPFVVFRIDDGWTPWSRRALRWADRVLVVADGTAGPAPAPIESELYSLLGDHQLPEVALVLVHPAGTVMPAGTRRWLDVRPAVSHYHAKHGDQASHDRLARLLSGTGTSLVLGGGGAKGFAHVGLLEALEEAGQAVDMVAGTSIGAIMAIGPAFGWPAHQSRRIAVDRFRKVFDYTVPTVSLLRGHRISAGLRDVVGDVDITDLWIPYFCVSTDLTYARPVFHDRGSLVTAIRASIAIPGVLPPVPVDGSLLVDGGVLDNVPVEEMRRRNPSGRVIAVDVATIDGPAAAGDYGLSVSGLRAWLDRRHGSGPPSLLTTLVRSTVVGSVGARNRVVASGTADLYLDVTMKEGGLLDFSGAEAIADAARHAARPVVGKWAAGELKEAYVEIEPRVPTRPAVKDGRKGRIQSVLLLTLRDLQFRGARFAAVVVATAVVLALLFLMTGLVEQFHREPRDTVAALGADRWALREGASGAFTSAATLDAALAAQLGERAAPVVIARHSLRTGSAQAPPVDVVVVGFAAGRTGQPQVVSGRLPTAPTEVAIDDSAAVATGATVHIGAAQYQVVGRTDGTTLFAGMPLVFMDVAAAQNLVYRGANLATAIVLDGEPATPVPDGLAVLSGGDVAADATRPLERSISSVNLIRVLLWFVAAMIVGTMLYLSALERSRDVAVLKAVGASTGQVVASIALQGVLVALVAAAVAAVIQALLVPVFPLEVSVPARALVQVPLVAVVVSLAAGGVGLRKALRVDPALAFSGPKG